MFAKRVRTTLILLAIVAAGKSAFATPILSVIPGFTSIDEGTPFFLDIDVTGVTDLFAFGFDVDYGPAPLKINGVSATEGAFLSSGGGGTTFTHDPYDNINGTLLNVAGALSGSGPSVSGSGVLARLGFLAFSQGVANVGLSNIQLLDSTLTQIDFDPPLAGVVEVRRAQEVTPVPEPGTLSLLALGGALLARRKRRAART